MSERTAEQIQADTLKRLETIAAFPRRGLVDRVRDDGMGEHDWQDGMSLRDYFAANALPSTLSASGNADGSYDYVAAAMGAYMVADAMLKARTP